MPFTPDRFFSIHFSKNNAAYFLLVLGYVFFMTMVSNSCADRPVQQNTTDITPHDSVTMKDPGRNTFVFGQADQFTVNVLYHEKLNRTVQVTPGGNIFLPVAGRIKAEGLTVSEVEEKIAERLRRYFVNPRINIDIGPIAEYHVYVMGEVQSPGKIHFTGDINIYEAISKAGGFTSEADKKNIFYVDISESSAKILLIDYENLFETGKIRVSYYLKKNNFIYVKEKKLVSLENLMKRIASMIGPFIDVEKAIILGPKVSDVF